MSQFKLHFSVVIVVALGFAVWLPELALAASQNSAAISEIIKPDNEPKVKKDSDVAPVMISIPGRNYEIGKYDVTQGEWRSVMGSNPSHFSNCGDNCPVEMVSWDDVQEFIQRLNVKTGRQYRLPTEAEWEYACFGGNQSEFCGDDDPNSLSWYDIEFRGSNKNTTHLVGQNRANGYGLYDMNVNVWQWLSDCRFGTCARHKLRGGSWYDVSQYLRTPFHMDVATNRDNFIGFRLARTLPQIPQIKNYPALIRIPGKDYEIGKNDVTQGEWRDVMGSNPSHFSRCGDNCPVEMVSWNDVQEFIQKLNAKTGRQYRLPTEAEWEYACYGGSNAEFCGGSSINSVAWYASNSKETTHPVGQMQANGYGIYDMSGNVWQWMNDCRLGECTKRVLRGGSWANLMDVLRAVFRSYGDPADRNDVIGFRLARTLP